MPYNTILVPTEPHDLMTSTLETALLLASQFDSYVEGFALRPAIDNFVAMDPISGMAMATVKQRDAEAATQAQSLFEGFMQSRQVPRSGARATIRKDRACSPSKPACSRAAVQC